jgi:hypothetical protein
MICAAKAIISFQGWNNQAFLKNIKYKENIGTLTELKDIRKECFLDQYPNRF